MSAGVVIGDSTCGGVGVGNAGVEKITWCQRLCDAAGLPLEVHSITGASSVEITQRVLPEITGQYALGLCFMGINDVKQVRVWTADGYRERMLRVLTRLAECCDRVAVQTLPPNLGRIPTIWPYGPRMRHRVRTTNRVIREVAAEVGAVVLEAPRLPVRSQLWTDGLHPTSLGHLRMAQSAARTLGTPVPHAPVLPLDRTYLRWWWKMTLHQGATRPPRAAVREVQHLADLVRQ